MCEWPNLERRNCMCTEVMEGQTVMRMPHDWWRHHVGANGRRLCEALAESRHQLAGFKALDSEALQVANAGGARHFAASGKVARRRG
jgi:hypothetical protein